MFSHPELGSDPPNGSGRELRRDKLVSELGLGVSGKSLILVMYLHRMCWPIADVFVLFIA